MVAQYFDKDEILGRPSEISLVRDSACRELEQMLTEFVQVASELGLEPTKCEWYETEMVHSGGILRKRTAHAVHHLAGSYMAYRVFTRTETYDSSGRSDSWDYHTDVDMSGRVRFGEGEPVPTPDALRAFAFCITDTSTVAEAERQYAKALEEWRKTLDRFLRTGTAVRRF
ncbi:MAG: hypothetical protein ACYC6C_11930 [Coriobacteriia bacterium]